MQAGPPVSLPNRISSLSPLSSLPRAHLPHFSPLSLLTRNKLHVARGRGERPASAEVRPSREAARRGQAAREAARRDRHGRRHGEAGARSPGLLGRRGRHGAGGARRQHNLPRWRWKRLPATSASPPPSPALRGGPIVPCMKGVSCERSRAMANKGRWWAAPHSSLRVFWDWGAAGNHSSPYPKIRRRPSQMAPKNAIAEGCLGTSRDAPNPS
jgi:hypothetical protein